MLEPLILEDVVTCRSLSSTLEKVVTGRSVGDCCPGTDVGRMRRDALDGVLEDVVDGLTKRARRLDVRVIGDTVVGDIEEGGGAGG